MGIWNWVMCILLEDTYYSFCSATSTNDLVTQVCLRKHRNQLTGFAFGINPALPFCLQLSVSAAQIQIPGNTASRQMTRRITRWILQPHRFTKFYPLLPPSPSLTTKLMLNKIPEYTQNLKSDKMKLKFSTKLLMCIGRHKTAGI